MEKNYITWLYVMVWCSVISPGVKWFVMTLYVSERIGLVWHCLSCSPFGDAKVRYNISFLQWKAVFSDPDDL